MAVVAAGTERSSERVSAGTLSPGILLSYLSLHIPYWAADCSGVVLTGTSLNRKGADFQPAATAG